MNSEKTENQLAVLQQKLLQAYPDLWAIYLFGSYARGDAWPSSDLDIGLLLPPARTLQDKLAVIADISSEFGCEVDLVDLRQAGNVLKKNVLGEGKILYLAEPAKTLEWEAITMTEFADHYTATREIRDEFEKTGIGYGA